MSLPTDQDKDGEAAPATKAAPSVKEDQTMIDSNEIGLKKFEGHTPGKFRKSKGLWVVATLALASCILSTNQIVDAIYAGTFKYRGGLVVFLSTYFLIDVFSGLLHIVLDNPNLASTPNLLQAPAIGFQEHHLNVNLIGKLSLQQHLSPIGIPVVVNTIVGQACAQLRDDKDSGCLYSVCSVAIAFFLVLMQMAHRWSHASMDKRPYGVVTLQKMGILLSPAEHSKHHRSPHVSHFCLLSGIMNAALNPIVKHVLKPDSDLWIYIFFGFFLAFHMVITVVQQSYWEQEQAGGNAIVVDPAAAFNRV